jgi:hypothetical protein
MTTSSRQGDETVTASASPPTTPAQHERSRWVALVVLCVGALMIVLDATIVNVALPSIQSDLGFSQADLAWASLSSRSRRSCAARRSRRRCSSRRASSRASAGR